MSAILVLATPTVAEVVAPAPPAPMRVWQRGPDVQVWAERSDGTRLDQVRDPMWAGDVELKRKEVGGFTLDVSLGDPGVWPLVVNSQRPARWDTEDIELAAYRQGRCVARGPVVDGEHSRGLLAGVRVSSHEAYVDAQHIGSESRRNWLLQGEALWPLVGWSTVLGAGYLTPSDEPVDTWEDGVPALRLQTDNVAGGGADGYPTGVVARADLPIGTSRNYAYLVVRVNVAPGAGLPFGLCPLIVEHFAGRPGPGGSVALASQGEPYYVLLPDDYVPGTYATLVVVVPQLANHLNRYKVRLLAATGDGVVFGKAVLERDENVSALMGQDEGVLFAALSQHLVGLMGASRWGRRSATVGRVLREDVRYLARVHDKARSILDEWDIDWWVEQDGAKKVICTGPRGRDVGDVLITSDNLADWRTRWDAVGAANVGIYGSPAYDGAAREDYGVRSGVVGPHRLPKVAMAPWDMTQRQLGPWADDDLERSGSVVSVSGVPFGLDGAALPGDVLDRLGLADRLRVRVRDQQDPSWAKLDYTLGLEVEALNWSPLSDRVVPVWAVPA